ncbi:uncharacterized protein LOC117110671 [Anneissia japonica]|uniref:uncharacterized protein LOC117110671 n=1 Tax=Anneissia japonica TaxID=1529436 RepID=UPI0014254F33|nr:uncharacterized protein LOC117110671 [Anneissia japonica]XP_033109329.1 uncharacterized protein LOC117110671 [Anneissia japonica]
MSINERRYAAQHIKTITNDSRKLTTGDVLKDLKRLDEAGEVCHQDVVLELLEGERKLNMIDKLRKDVISTFKLKYVLHAETLTTEAHKGLIILYAKTGKRTSDILILKCTETMASIVVNDLNRSARKHSLANRKAVSFRTASLSSSTSSSGSEQGTSSRMIPIAEKPDPPVQENYRLAQVHEDFLGRTVQELSVRSGELVKVLDSSRNWWKVSDQFNNVGYLPCTIMAYVKLNKRRRSSTKSNNR